MLLSGQTSLEAFGFRSLAIDSSSALENELATPKSRRHLHDVARPIPPSVDEHMPESDIIEVESTESSS
jgi:hypothetical protein